MRHTGHHEGVLHVDHDQRGLGRIEVGVDMLAAVPGHHAIDNRLRD